MALMHDKCNTLQVICGLTSLHYFCMHNASHHTLERQGVGNSTQLVTGWNFFFLFFSFFKLFKVDQTA